MRNLVRCVVVLALVRTMMMVGVTGEAAVSNVSDGGASLYINITASVSPAADVSPHPASTTTTFTSTTTAAPSTTTTTAATTPATTTFPYSLIRAWSAPITSPPQRPRPRSKSPHNHYRQRLYFPAALPTPATSSPSTFTTSSSPYPLSASQPTLSPASFVAFHIPGTRTSPMVSMFYHVDGSASSPPAVVAAAASPPAFFRVPPPPPPAASQSHFHPPPPPLPVIQSTPSPSSPSTLPAPATLPPINVPLSHPRPRNPSSSSSSFPLPPSHPSLIYPYHTPLWGPPVPPSPAPVRRERTIPSTAPPPPYFDTGTPTNVTAQQGTHAFLSCIVRNLDNQSISWVRSRDSHILTVDRYTFIADQRFQARYHPDEERWTLQVKFVQGRDDGRYECQVSTEPKISRFVYFHVVTPVVHIPGGPDMYVKSGSRVTIKCIISAALHQPQYIFWYQGKERVVASESGRGGREVWVERPGQSGMSPGAFSSSSSSSSVVVGGNSLARDDEERTVGTLVIPRASPRDQGTYTCAPASLPNTTVTLHVLNGEHPAAMYSGSAPHCRPPTPLLFLLPLLLCWLLGGVRPHQPPLAPRPR